MSFSKNIMESGKSVQALVFIGITIVILLVILGNLSGNVGFATGTQGANDTRDVIGNVTTGIKTFTNFLPTIFQILGVVLLIIILLSLLLVARRAFSSGSGEKGFKEY